MLELVSSVNAALLGFMPPLAAIVLWAILSAGFSMFIYARLSPQKRLSGLKAEHKAARQELIRHDGDFAEMQTLIMKDLRLSLKQMGLIFPSFVISVLPVFALMFCLFVLYGYSLPAARSEITVTVSPANAELGWQATHYVQQAAEGTWVIKWPEPDAPTHLKDASGNTVLTFPVSFPIPEVTKENWLTMLFPNPNGNLNESAPVDAVYMDLPSRQYTHFGPQWTRGFEFWYIAVLLVASLFIKIRFRII